MASKDRQYLRHETTEKWDGVDSYQPYLAVARVKQTRCCRRGCGRRADYVCWWSQHSHQALQAFNLRQRFGNLLSSWFVKVLCFQNCFCQIFLDFSLLVSLPFTWFSRCYANRVWYSCALFCYTSAKLFCSLFFIQHTKLLACSNVTSFLD